MEMPNLPQPFNPETIKKYPVAVLAAFLIGVILLQWGFNRWDKEQQHNEFNAVRRLKDSVLRSELLFYRTEFLNCQKESKRMNDSLLKEKYGLLVQKTLKNYEK